MRTDGPTVGRRTVLAAALLALAPTVTACASDDGSSRAELSGIYCADGPRNEQVENAGVTAEVCLEADRSDGVFLRAIGLENDSTVTVTGGQGDTLSSTWIAAEAGGLVNGIPRFGMLLDGQIVSSPLRVAGTWADGTPMQLSVTW